MKNTWPSNLVEPLTRFYTSYTRRGVKYFRKQAFKFLGRFNLALQFSQPRLKLNEKRDEEGKEERKKESAAQTVRVPSSCFAGLAYYVIKRVTRRFYNNIWDGSLNFSQARASLIHASRDPWTIESGLIPRREEERTCLITVMPVIGDYYYQNITEIENSSTRYAQNFNYHYSSDVFI